MTSKLDSWRRAAYNAEECLAGCLASPEIAKHLDQGTARTILERLSQARIEMLAASNVAQPAGGEPVAWMTRPLRGSHKGRDFICEPDASLNLDQREKPFPVYAAPPAAAHGDEAVRKDAGRYQALRNTPEIFIGVAEGDDMVFLKSPDQLDQLADNAAAMRAQGDRGGS